MTSDSFPQHPFPYNNYNSSSKKRVPPKQKGSSINGTYLTNKRPFVYKPLTFINKPEGVTSSTDQSSSDGTLKHQEHLNNMNCVPGDTIPTIYSCGNFSTSSTDQSYSDGTLKHQEHLNTMNNDTGVAIIPVSLIHCTKRKFGLDHLMVPLDEPSINVIDSIPFSCKEGNV